MTCLARANGTPSMQCGSAGPDRPAGLDSANAVEPRYPSPWAADPPGRVRAHPRRVCKEGQFRVKVTAQGLRLCRVAVSHRSGAAGFSELSGRARLDTPCRVERYCPAPWAEGQPGLARAHPHRARWKGRNPAEVTAQGAVPSPSTLSAAFAHGFVGRPGMGAVGDGD
jgi:hypothetical protein